MSQSPKRKSKKNTADDEKKSGGEEIQFQLDGDMDIEPSTPSDVAIDPHEGEPESRWPETRASENEDVDAEARETDDQSESNENIQADIEGSELAHFEAAEIEEVVELTPAKIQSIVESLLFATDRAQSVLSLKSAFVGTTVRAADIRLAIENLNTQYSLEDRGVFIEEITGGYQIRTKAENRNYLNRLVKSKTFKLSPPALEVLSIVAYKQPCPKALVDEVRGVESGHLMRALLDRGLLQFAGKSDLPGRPMLYETTRKFLEIFGLRNVEELPSMGEIDQLLPNGVDEAMASGAPTLGDLTGELSKDAPTVYSENEEELQAISSDLQNIDLTTEFFEQEKARQKAAKDKDRADEIKERILVGEEVSTKDKRWLEKYEQGLLVMNTPVVNEPTVETINEPTIEATAATTESTSELTTDQEIDRMVEEIAQNALRIQESSGSQEIS